MADLSAIFLWMINVRFLLRILTLQQRYVTMFKT